MRKATALPFLVVATIVGGGLLYLYGSPALHSQNGPTGAFAPQPMDLPILAQGDAAAGVNDRVNYRITSADQLTELWKMLYTDSGQPVPNVDFRRYEVLALFDGSHTTSGYGIQLTSVSDAGGKRTVTITHLSPGNSCTPSGGITSPFVIVQVPKSSLPITRIENSYTNQCE